MIAILALVNGAGCGGSTETEVNPSVTIDWPTRTRGFEAPTSAVSANIVLEDSLGPQPDNAHIALRSSNGAAHSETYTFPTKSKLGFYTLTITFRADSVEPTQSVGIVTIPVRLTGTGLTNPDGTPLGNISFERLIKSVTVTPNQTLGVGTKRQLTATARDELSNPIVVSPGSFTFAVRSGSENLSVTPDGVATGIAVGAAMVYATVDNVQSPDATVTVLQELRTTVDVESYDLAFDPVSELIWSTVGSNGAHANSIVGIDPKNGLVVREIPLGVTPYLFAITDDGQFAYVNIPSDGTTRRIDLATGTETLSIPTGTAVSICTVPGSPHTVLVGGNPIGGVNVSVWDDAVRRANTGAGGYFIHMASPTIMYGNGGGSLFTCVLVPGAINWTDQKENLITNDFIVHNGLLIDADGHVVDPTTMTSVGQLSAAHFLSNGRHIASSESDNRVYIVTWNAVVNKQILCYDLTTYAELPQRDTGFIPGGAIDLVACGNNTVAFRDFGAIVSPNQIFIFRGMP